MPKKHTYKEFLAVDLGSYSIKLIVGKISAGGVAIKKARTIPVSANMYSNGDIQDIGELSNVLKDFVKDNGLKHFPVLFTFSSTSTITRVLDIPAVAIAELKDVIEYEMQQFLPTDISQYVIEFKLISEAKQKDQNMTIMAAAVPKTLAENLWRLAKECELTPAALDINTNALTKLLSAAQGINGTDAIATENVALVEIGHTLMDISIFEKGVFQFDRRILIGGQNIDQRIERLMEISIEEVRLEKHNRIDINQEISDYTDENRILNSLKTGVDEWIQEIERVLNFYRGRKLGNKLDRLYLYGGGAGILGIDNYISKALEVNTEVIHELGGITIKDMPDSSRMNVFLNAVGALIRKEG